MKDSSWYDYQQCEARAVSGENELKVLFGAVLILWAVVSGENELKEVGEFSVQAPRVERIRRE